MNKQFDVLGIGELNVDIVLTGLDRMPVLGKEIIAEACRVTLGSSTAICASGLARLGLSVAFAGLVGKDDFGTKVLDSLHGYGINTENVKILDRAETGVTICLNAKGDRALVTSLGGTIADLSAEDIPDELISKVRHVHVGSFFLQKNLRPGLSELFKKAKDHGATTSLDAGWDDTGNWDYGLLDVLRHVDIFFPNESEALAITGRETVPEAASVLARYAPTVVKCGAEGAYFQIGDRVIIKEAVKGVTPVDTTGAGDSFNAGFIYAMLEKKPWSECLDYGNACGAVSVTRIGGASSCATLEEAERIVLTGKI